MNMENIIILVVLGILFGLFVLRVVKNKKIYDAIILVMIVLVAISKLPIGDAIPKNIFVAAILALALVVVLLFLKSKANALKEAQKMNNTPKDN